MALGLEFMFVILLLPFAVAVSTVVAENSTEHGYTNLVSVSGSDYNYQISPADRITKYPLIKRTFEAATTLLDGGSTLLLSDGGATNDRLLYLTNTTIEVYRDDPNSFRSLYEASLPLEPGRVPWYIASSSAHDTGIFYVVYRGDRGYTDYLYDIGLAEFLEPRYVNVPVNAILTTMDDNDVIAFIGENGQTVEMETMAQSLHSIISADLIASDCTSLRTLYPFDPIEEHRVYFGVTCTTNEGTTRHYSVEYLYQTSPLNLTASPLASGIPASWKQYLAVYDGADLTLYDRRNFDTNVPGHHRFASRVRRVVFAEVADRIWLTVQIDGGNTFVIDVSLFIASHGSRGVYELENTEIDCFPSCLPVVSTKAELIVVSVNVELSYSCVVFGLSTGVPVEIRRIENIPERPFGVVFVPDPTYQPSLPTSPPPTVQPPAFDNLPVILGPLGGFLLILIFVGTVLPVVYMRIRNKNRRIGNSNLSVAAVHGVATISTAIQPELTCPVGTSPPLELVAIPTKRPAILPLSKNVKETDIDDPMTPLLGPDSYSVSIEGDSSAPIEGDPSAPIEGHPPAPIEGDPPAPIVANPQALPLVVPQEESRECRPVEATERQGPSSIQVTSTGAKEPSIYNVTPTANPAKK